jgi:hypothetical protein
MQSVSWKSTSSCGSLVSACVTILVPTVPRKSHQVVTLSVTHSGPYVLRMVIISV